MNEILLEGCQPEPIGSYLKGLGVFRLVAEQATPDARGRWTPSGFVLHTDLSLDDLMNFFLDVYVPTPLVAPWNGGSGFGPKDQQSGIRAIESSEDPRLVAYRGTITIARKVHDRVGVQGLSKESEVELCRAELPDACVRWLDSSVVLTGDGLGYPPLLGTGGNDGRFEFSNNFMQHLVEALRIGESPSADGSRSRRWLQAALFPEPTVPRLKRPIGQFDPGAAGGVNSSPFGATESLVDPWDFILLMEGALLFASGSARRLMATMGRRSMPFMFGSSAAGFASAAQAERSRGEIWTPIWSHPATFSEVVHLFGEGRSEWTGRQARTGLEAAKAATSLGVDRGVDQFVRHIFVERFGRNTLVVPVGHIQVIQRPGVSILAELDNWIDTVRRKKAPPAAVATALRRFDSAAFELASRAGTARLQHVLIAAAVLEGAVGRSGQFRSAPPEIRPISEPKAAAWIPLLDDGSSELRIAAALASSHDDDGDCLRMLLRPVLHPDGPSRRVRWSDGSAPVDGLESRDIVDVLASALARRALEAGGASLTEESVPGVQTSFRWWIAARADDVPRFLARQLDEERLRRLLQAMMLLDWRGNVDIGGAHRQPRSDVALVPDPAWTLLCPFFHGRPIEWPGGGSLRLTPEASWPAQLAAGRTEPVIRAALRRLRIARLDPALIDPSAIARSAAPGPRLAAALLCPISGSTATASLRRAVPEPLD